jgi:hypothetical protein
MKESGERRKKLNSEWKKKMKYGNKTKEKVHRRSEIYK